MGKESDFSSFTVHDLPKARIISNQVWVKDAYNVDVFAGTGVYVKTGETKPHRIKYRLLMR